MDRQEVPPELRPPADGRAGARPVFHRHGLLRARQRHLRHRAVPGALPDRLPLHRPALDHPAVCWRRRRERGVEDGYRERIVNRRMATTAPAKAGLEDVVATTSAICYLDGDNGVLAYCGY